MTGVPSLLQPGHDYGWDEQDGCWQDGPGYGRLLHSPPGSHYRRAHLLPCLVHHHYALAELVVSHEDCVQRACRGWREGTDTLSPPQVQGPLHCECVEHWPTHPPTAGKGMKRWTTILVRGDQEPALCRTALRATAMEHATVTAAT